MEMICFGGGVSEKEIYFYPEFVMVGRPLQTAPRRFLYGNSGSSIPSGHRAILLHHLDHIRPRSRKRQIRLHFGAISHRATLTLDTT